MRVVLITAPTNGAGLERDCQILRGLLEGAGHEVVAVDHKSSAPPGPFDLAIFDEVFVPAFANLAPVRWLTPHPEWWFPEWTPHLGLIDRVLCKTRDAQRAFGRLGAHTIFTGFRSVDRLDSTVPRERRFLHVAGKSDAKGTAAVLEAWRKYKIPHPLTVVSTASGLKAPSKAVKLLGRIPDADLLALQNASLFVLQPSSYEGFGHVLHEALSCGSVLATTDAPPMNDLGGGAALIPPVSFEDQRLGRLAHVDAAGVYGAVEAMWSMGEEEIHAARSLARATYEQNVAEFEETFLELVATVAAGVKRVVPPGPRLAVVYPAHASAAALVLRSLMALRHQTAAPESFEVVVAADGGDPNGDLAGVIAMATNDSLPGRSFRCRLVESPRPRGEVPHRNHARNAGWRAASAPLCWMLDSDFILPPHAVEHLIAEHDAAFDRGKPAVFTSCLAGVGAIGIETWAEKTQPWMQTGKVEHFLAALDCGGVSPIYSGFPELYAGPATPASVPLADLPEGMPVVWRSVLEALGGFDEAFGEWGGDKEEFVDRLKGCARAGLFEVRLLTSVQALHQPHDPDPTAKEPGAKVRQAQREKRARGILSGEPWWKAQLALATAAVPTAALIAGPRSSGEACPASVLEAVTKLVLAKARSARGARVVIGRWASAVAGPLGAEVSTLAALAVREPKSVGQVVLLDALSSLPPAELAAVGASLLRVCHGGVVVAVERTKLGAPPGSVGLRAPLEYQRAIRGLAVAGQRAAGAEVFTVFLSRLAA